MTRLAGSNTNYIKPTHENMITYKQMEKKQKEEDSEGALEILY